MLTTIVDHNDIRLRSMQSDGGKPCSQVNDSSRQGAGSLQAEDHWFDPPPPPEDLRLRQGGTRADILYALHLKVRISATILTPVNVQSVTSLITAATPLLVGTISGIWAVTRVRGSKADRLLRIMRDEVELMTKLPNDSAAVQELKARIDDTARQYADLRRRQSQLRRDPVGIVLGAILSFAGISLAAYAAYNGGYTLLWDIIAFPLMLFGIIGFFYELSGGRSREKDAPLPPPDEPEPEP